MWRVVSRSIELTYALFAARALMEDRVDSGPRDHRFELGSNARHTSTSPGKGKMCGTMSHTEKITAFVAVK